MNYLSNNTFTYLRLLLFLICIPFNQGTAQQGPRERIKTLKIAYITEQVALSSTEAQKFWPIYNDYEHLQEKLKRLERESIKSIRDTNGADDLQEQEAARIIMDIIKYEEQKVHAQKKLLTDLKKVISQKKILKLLKAEKDFHRKLLKQLRERRN